MVPEPVQVLSPGHSDGSPLLGFSSVGDGGRDDDDGPAAPVTLAASGSFSWLSEGDGSAASLSRLDSAALALESSMSSVSPPPESLFLGPAFRLSHGGLIEFLAFW